MSEQPFRNVPPEKRLQPEGHLQEEITKPERLAEIVLNTLQTVDYSLLDINSNNLGNLMQNRSQNWTEIAKIARDAAKCATLFEPQIMTISQGLDLVEYHNDPLPVAIITVGNPPKTKTIIDRRSVGQLTKKRAEEERIRPDIVEEVWNGKDSKAKLDEAVYSNPVRSLARMINKFLLDTLAHRSLKVRNYFEILEMVGVSEYQEEFDPLIEELIKAMADIRKYASCTLNAVEEYSKGNIPDNDTIRKTTSGTNQITNYLETFSRK